MLSAAMETRRGKPIEYRPFTDSSATLGFFFNGGLFQGFLFTFFKLVMWHLKPDTWLLPTDMWHVIQREWWHFFCKFYVPSFYGLGPTVFWKYLHKAWLTNWLAERDSSVIHHRISEQAFFKADFSGITVFADNIANSWETRKRKGKTKGTQDWLVSSADGLYPPAELASFVSGLALSISRLREDFS